MQSIPDTRASLLLRIRDPADGEAWAEFAAIYRPVIYRLGRRRGLQEADAQDLTQRVLTSVATAVKSWEPDPTRGRFRSWLTTVTRNAIVDGLRRVKPDAASGGTSFVQRLQQHAQPDATDEELEQEYRRELFRQAAREIREEFEDVTWQAFWLTTVDNRTVAEVAESLMRSSGSVYAARSRVMRRLREKVRQLDDDE